MSAVKQMIDECYLLSSAFVIQSRTVPHRTVVPTFRVGLSSAVISLGIPSQTCLEESLLGDSKLSQVDNDD